MENKKQASKFNTSDSCKDSFDYLNKEFGPIAENQSMLIKSVTGISKQVLQQKVKFLKDYLKLSNQDIRKCITILDLSEENIKSKFDFLREYLGFKHQDLVKFPRLIAYSPSAIMEKYRYFSEELGLTKLHIKHYPKLLSLDCFSDENNPKSVPAKLKFYEQTLGYSKKQIQINPNLLMYDCLADENLPNSIKGKIKFYRENLGFENINFQKYPKCFDYDCSKNAKTPTSIITKIKFLTEEIGIPKEKLKTNFEIACLDLNSVKNKVKTLDEIGISKETIASSPRILSQTANEIRDKYVLWCNISPDKGFLKVNSWFLTSAQKVYARYKYLLSISSGKSNGTLPLPMIKSLGRGENEFLRRYNASSEELLQLYHFDENIKNLMYDNYNAMNIEPEIQRGQQ